MTKQPSEIRKLTGSDAVALLEGVADKFETRIARAYLDRLDVIRETVSVRDLTRLIEEGRTQELLDLLEVPGANNALEREITQAVLEGARASAQGMADPLQPGAAQITVNALNPRLGEFAQRITSRRVRELEREQREHIANIVARGTTQGDNPITTARSVRDGLGLTAWQEAQVQTYRRQLEDLDRRALERQLRDKRSDRTVRRALDTEKPLSKAQIESMVARYRNRFIKYRSQVIGRTESIRAANGAQHELLQDLVASGKVDPRQIRRYWIHTPDERTRLAHRQIASMNEAGVGLNEPFQTPLGPLLYPGDPDGLPANTIQCRCTVFSRIISRELIPGLT